ncbi:hypothetical protein EV05_0095 [Prochlorococcus sp. MIT 0601]|nr:hypothetical protein EV05_0095 [Prochlorococcus sp. MIT 0601]
MSGTTPHEKLAQVVDALLDGGKLFTSHLPATLVLKIS